MISLTPGQRGAGYLSHLKCKMGQISGPFVPFKRETKGFPYNIALSASVRASFARRTYLKISMEILSTHIVPLILSKIIST